MNESFCLSCLKPLHKGETSCPNCGQFTSAPLSADNSLGNSRGGGFRSSFVTYKTKHFPISTTDQIYGEEIIEILGLVFVSSSRTMALSSSNAVSNAFQDGVRLLEQKAREMGADAVVGLKILIEKSGIGITQMETQTVTLSGTAVVLRRDAT